MKDTDRTVIRDVAEIAKNQGIDLFLVGAVARDELFADTESQLTGRATYDIDFACHLKDWKDYDEFISGLEASGNFKRDSKTVHRVTHLPTETAVDLVPFGEIESPDHLIIWPPDGDVEMNVHGYTEAYSTAIPLEGNARRIGPEWYSMLKLNTWLEAPNRGKDIEDFDFVTRHCTEFMGEERIWESEILELEPDVDLAAVRFLGRDCATVSPGFVECIISQIFESEVTLELLRDELGSYDRPGMISGKQILSAFRHGIDDVLAERQSQELPPLNLSPEEDKSQSKSKGIRF